MSSAKRVVDSTLRRILRYTSEILISIILLVLISLPLIFAVPMWIQEIIFGVPSANLAVNPIVWFGPVATFGITIGLGIFSFILGYLFLYRFIPSTQTEQVPAEETKEADESTMDEQETDEPTESLEEDSLSVPEESDDS